jgi:hypothetical protein
MCRLSRMSCERALFASEATPSCSTLTNSAWQAAKKQHVICGASATFTRRGAILTYSHVEDNSLCWQRQSTKTESASVPFSTRLHPPPS